MDDDGTSCVWTRKEAAVDDGGTDCKEDGRTISISVYILNEQWMMMGRAAFGRGRKQQWTMVERTVKKMDGRSVSVSIY